MHGVALVAARCGLALVLANAARANPAEVFQFGTAELNSQLPHRFLLANTNDAPVMIQAVVPSCDCIHVTNWPASVAGGATGAVEIVFIPDKVGQVDYRVFVKIASSNPPELEYAIQGVVTSAPASRRERDWQLYLDAKAADDLVHNPGHAIWVDVRSSTAHMQARIANSIQMPLYAVKTKGFLRERKVVLVDEGCGSPAVENETRRLRAAGFQDVSIWHGGLNAWQRQGGLLEGPAAATVAQVPPAALAAVIPAPDWLVVAVNGDAPPDLPESVALPLDPARPDAFADALNAVTEARPHVATVLILAASAGDSQAIGKLADRINALVFYPEGGRPAWEAHLNMLSAIHSGRTVVTSDARSVESGGRVRSGCGGCPK